MLSDRTDESSGFFGSKATSIRGRVERIVVVSDFHGQLILKKKNRMEVTDELEALALVSYSHQRIKNKITY